MLLSLSFPLFQCLLIRCCLLSMLLRIATLRSIRTRNHHIHHSHSTRPLLFVLFAFMLVIIRTFSLIGWTVIRVTDIMRIT